MRIGSLTAAAVLLGSLLATGASSAVPWNPAGAESLNVRILGSYAVNSPVNNWDCCAYIESSTGHEYGVLGADSVYVIDLADPSRPRRASTIPPYSPPPNKYVDVAVRGVYLYAAERQGPIRIADLTDPYHPVIRGEIPQSEFCACSCGHPCNDPQQAEIETIFIDERGILYVTGINCGEGVQTYDIATDPIHPRWLCEINTRPPGSSSYTHDLYARGGILYLSRSRQTATVPPRWDILDGDPLCPAAPGPCGDGLTPALISTFTHTGPELHSHSAWPLDDPGYLLTCDEKTNGHVRVWNIQDLAHPFQVAAYQADGTCHSVHNAYPVGGTVYTAWYNKGLQVYDLSSPGSPIRIGYYQHPSRWLSRPGDPCCDPTLGAQAGCHGIWFIDPFFPSGIFIASEMDNGLLVGRFQRQAVDVASPAGGPAPPASTSGASIHAERMEGGAGLKITWQARPSERDLARSGSLDIFAASGRLVARLRAAAEESPGRFVYLWDGRDDSGRSVPPAIYFARPPGWTRTDAMGKLLLLEN
jgi:hypothetical protein